MFVHRQNFAWVTVAQLGNGGVDFKSTPVAVSGMESGVVMVTAGAVRDSFVLNGFVYDATLF